MKVRLRARARRDIDAILDYTSAEHGDHAAEAYFLILQSALDRLAEHPEIGMARADLKSAMRSLPAGEHRLYYLLLADRISVVRVLHKSMDEARHV